MKLQMRVAPLGYGKRCHACKTVGQISSFQLWRGNSLEKNIQLCNDCLNQEVTADVTLGPTEKAPDPFKSKQARKQVKQSRKMEAALAEKMGGRAQPGSGCSRLSGFKGDIRKIGSWRVEHKYTDAANVWSLRLSDLAKITGLAMDADEYPALVIEYRKARESFAIIPLTLFLEMVHEAEEHSAPPRGRRKRR